MDLTLFGCIQCASHELTLAVGIVLRSVSSCDMCHSVQRVEIVDPLFLSTAQILPDNNLQSYEN